MMKLNFLPNIKPQILSGLNKINQKSAAMKPACMSETSDTFCKQSYIDKISTLKASDYNVAVNWQARCKIKDISSETYKDLTVEELNALRSSILPETAAKAENIINISKSLKEHFDNKYGEQKYSFVSIGRSLAAVSKCLEYMGVESKRVPFSGCNSIPFMELNSIFINKIISQEGFREYKQFLQKILSTGKTNLLCDYCASGTTLKTFEEIVSHPTLGLMSDKNVFININNLIKQLAKDSLITGSESKCFLRNLDKQAFDDVAMISSLKYDSLGSINSALSPRFPEKKDFFNFIILDMLKDMKYLK